MATSNLMSLPVDIPWTRLGISLDMIDDQPNREYPPKWRSSVAVFSYEPPEQQQQLPNITITFLKVSCTITGCQQGREVSMPAEKLLSPWEREFFAIKNIAPYFPCYGAMLQVAVFPQGQPGVQLRKEQYPFILDLEPKKREMYESATEAKEFMSHSRSGIGVKKGTTTIEREESGWNIGAAIGFGAGPLTASISGGYNAKSGSSVETVDMTTADYSREKRENYSYTTNLTHMYHLLNAYHLGTNRAMFLIQPRPHIVDTEYTFVNGPRRLEGVQEFFLIVARQNEGPGICIEATLETAHIQMMPVWQARIIPKSDLNKDDNASKTFSALGLQAADRNNQLESLATGGGVVSWGIDAHGNMISVDTSQGGFLGWNQIPADFRQAMVALIRSGTEKPESLPWQVWNTCNQILGYLPGINPSEDVQVIYERLNYRTGALILTGRTTTTCVRPPRRAPPAPDFLTYEAQVLIPAEMDNPLHENISRAAIANRFSEFIGQQMIESLSSPERFPYGAVTLQEASFFQKPLLDAVAAMPDDHPYNVSLDEIRGLDEIHPELRARLAEKFGVVRRKEALLIEPYQLRVGLGLEEADIRILRSALIGEGSRPEAPAEHVPVIVPNVEGTLLDATRQILARNMLSVPDEVVYQDSLLPFNTVLSQFPNPGSMVRHGSTVNLIVSSGPAKVPDVVGQTAEEATARLRELTLRVLLSDVMTDEKPEGRVLETTPAANTNVPKNSQVVLLIASSPSKGRIRNSLGALRRLWNR